MSYSRWGTSAWYTFWNSGSPKLPWSKPDQIFEICDFPSFRTTYGAIRSDIDGVIGAVALFYDQEHPGQVYGGIVPESGKPFYEDTVWPAKRPTELELEELKQYMLTFVEDMDNHFSLREYLRYEVWYPIRNWLHRSIRTH